jgi:hypothetical protein
MAAACGHAVSEGGRPAEERGQLMRAGGIIGVLTLVVLGVMFADLEIHPAGTTAAANGVVDIEKPGLNALLGTTS